MTIKARSKRRPVRPAQIARAIDEGRESLDLYLDEISRVPLLNREEEMELARRAFKGNVTAQERLARHNVRFVVSVAKKFQNRGVPLVDLIGEGNLGLMTAARKFDPDRGVKFISYAVWWIRQAVQAAIAVTAGRSGYRSIALRISADSVEPRHSSRIGWAGCQPPRSSPEPPASRWRRSVR